MTIDPTTSDRLLDPIRIARAAGQTLILLSDYDGTLTDIAERTG